MLNTPGRLLFITVVIELILMFMWLRSAFNVDYAFVEWRSVGSMGVISAQGRVGINFYERDLAGAVGLVATEPLEEDSRGLKSLNWAPGWPRYNAPGGGVLPHYGMDIPYWFVAVLAGAPLLVQRMRTRKRIKEGGHV